MTTLPSFVELVATLGLDSAKGSSQDASSCSSASQSSPSSPRADKLGIPATSPTRSRSSPSLRDCAARSRTARYSPYSPTLSTSSSPRPSPSPRMRRKAQSNKLSINIFGSSTDLAANTPISSYVRRKTPMTSPTSPTFSRSRSNPPSYPMTLPKLPTFLPRSASSDSFPLTPESEVEGFTVGPAISTKPSLSEDAIRSSRYQTGIRISTSPRSSNVNVNAEKYPRHPVVQVV
ncbi:hypothetical protein AAF712_002136 [Marasmius tenuissimus]|uniref:Uncharacterized protein n=1 Tax=Marasmius tenuissimus TaxID=585030 RepID=A0ABR3ABP4_9AGAR